MSTAKILSVFDVSRTDEDESKARDNLPGIGLSKTDHDLTKTNDSLQKQQEADSLLLSTISEINRYHCSPIFEPQMLDKIRESKSLKYMMISRCNYTSKGSPNVKNNNAEYGIKIDQNTRKCLSSDYQSMVESTPVISNEVHGGVYRSASCARCNGLRDDQFTYLNVTLSWDGPKHAYESDLNDKKCVFKLDEKFDKLKCYYDHPRSLCSDPELAPLCHSFSSPLTHEKFANYFCYKCSGDLVVESPQNMINGTGRNLSSCREGGLGQGSGPPSGWSIILDFSGKINIEGGWYEGWSSHQRCNKGQVYDVFTRSCSGNGQRQKTVHTIQSIDKYITTFGSSISIVCYLLVIFTYSKFKMLQNVPGLNTLAMSICLLVAYTAFLFRSYHCESIVVLAHYFLLVSLMWVAIICVDLAVAMHSSVSVIRSQTDKLKTLRRYLAIAFLVPVPFVVTPIILNETNQIEVGYKERCWILHFGARLGSSIIPTALVYLIAIGSLVTTFIKIHRTRKETKNILETNQTNVNLVKMALKMTLGLGIIDILGFIQIRDIELAEMNMGFSMVYSIVVSLKGVFVCVLYLANKKVFNLYKCWFKRSLGTQNISSTDTVHAVEMT